MNDPVSRGRVLKIRLPDLRPHEASVLLDLFNDLLTGFFEAYDAELARESMWENEVEGDQPTDSMDDDEIPF